MKNLEGIIKYSLNHHHIMLDEHISISEINAWRTVFFELELIGQIKGRYGGYGFGNISQRISQENTKALQFLISGTQTGNLKTLSKHHYCTVLEAFPDKNSVKSEGKIKPSSEALTHASIYQQDRNIQAVIHIHCQKIWNNTRRLDLPHTSANIAYGTPEMAIEVEKVLNLTTSQYTGVFSMLGHKDGVVAFSDSMEKAACSLIKLYSKATAIEQNDVTS